MLSIETIRYMGNKSKLINYIIPAIREITPVDGVVCDLMAGSNSVSYALKEYFTVYTNDVQTYSYAISKGLIENNQYSISMASAIADVQNNIIENRNHGYYHLFYDTYSGTYFSEQQCKDIDSVKYAIDQLEDNGKKYLYITALMAAMCTIQSSPGHFAQFMPATHSRIIPLQAMNLIDEFYKKCDNYSNIYFNNCNNRCFCMDYKELFNTGFLNNINTIYLDSPYSQEQYSRFYHVLETLVKYDYPKVEHKAKYRTDRFMSDFCYKNKVATEFTNIISYCAINNINLLISYSNKALLPINELTDICNNYFENVETTYIDYKHSTQGKGSQELKELLIKCNNARNR